MLEDKPLALWSASKMVCGYTILKLVDEGLMSLHMRPADVFDFWNAADGRQNVTVRHLLSLTSGLTKFPNGFGRCTNDTLGIISCANESYHHGFPPTFTQPGMTFEYAEASFFVVGAMALQATGLETFNEVFQKYTARLLGIAALKCRYIGRKADPGGGLRCSTLEYAKILRAISSKSLLRNKSLYVEAHTPHTLNAGRSPAQKEAKQSCSDKLKKRGCDEDAMPEWLVGQEAYGENLYWHYGLGQWIECATPKCEGGILRASSRGARGTYPFVDPGTVSGNVPHWGVVMRSGSNTGAGTMLIENEVLPKIADVVNPAAAPTSGCRQCASFSWLLGLLPLAASAWA